MLVGAFPLLLTSFTRPNQLANRLPTDEADVSDSDSDSDLFCHQSARSRNLVLQYPHEPRDQVESVDERQPLQQHQQQQQQQQQQRLQQELKREQERALQLQLENIHQQEHQLRLVRTHHNTHNLRHRRHQQQQQQQLRQRCLVQLPREGHLVSLLASPRTVMETAFSTSTIPPPVSLATKSSDTSDEVVLHDDGRGRGLPVTSARRHHHHYHPGQQQQQQAPHHSLNSVPSVDISAASASSLSSTSPSTSAVSTSTSPASSNDACSPSSSASISIPASRTASIASSNAARANSAAADDIDAVSKPRRTSTLDPYNLRQRKSMRIRDAELMNSLSFNAVEVVVEFSGMTRVELFSDAYDVAALYTSNTTIDSMLAAPGTSDITILPAPSTAGGGTGEVNASGRAKESWTHVETSERIRCSSQMRCLKKFRMRAATTVDRNETYAIALFAANRAKDLGRLTPHDALGFQRISVAELLAAPNMMVEKRLVSGRRETTSSKGKVSLALDLVYHMERDRRISLRLGFHAEAERRNRMFFEVSRALRRGKWAPLYKSEVRTRNDAAWFDRVAFSSQEFHGGDEKKLFRIELFRWYRNGRTRALGFAQASFEKLLSLRVKDSLYWWPVEDGIATTKLVLQACSIGDDECSFEFVMAPLQPR